MNYFVLFLHHSFHKGHLSHRTRDRTDDQSWSIERFIWDNYFIDVGLQLIFDPEREWCDIVFRNRIFRLYVLLFLLFFDSFQTSFDILTWSLNVREFQAFIGADLIENNLFYVSTGNKNWDSFFGQRICKRTILSCCSIWRNHIKNDILGIFLLGYIILETEISILGIQLISIQINHIFFEIWIDTSFFNENTKVIIPNIISIWILFSLIFQGFY